MSSKQKRIAIARAAGWTVFDTRTDGGEPHGFPPAGWVPTTKWSWFGHNKLAHLLPEYPKDISAILPLVEARGRAVTMTFDGGTYRWAVEIIRYAKAWKGAGDTLAEACCEAFLNSHNSNPNEPA